MEELSDEVILCIASFLNIRDVMSISCINQRFNKICKDKSLCSVADFHNSRKLPDKIVLNYIENFRYSTLKSVNFEDCYWLSSTTIQRSLQKCRNLVEINFLGCNVSAKALNSILLHNPKIINLSWSVPEKIKEETRQNPTLCYYIRNQFKKLKSLHLRIDHLEGGAVWDLLSTEMVLLHLTVFFAEADNRIPCYSYMKIKSYEGFSLAPVCTVSLLHPRVPQKYVSRNTRICLAVLNALKSVVAEEIITSIHGGLLPHTNVHLKKLEVPGPSYLIAENTNDLVYFNSSKSCTISSDNLLTICRMNADLKYLNLHGCQNCFGDDLRELHVITSNWRNLRQLNIGQIHYHSRTNANELLKAIGEIKTLESLALSFCMLARSCPEDLSNAKQGTTTGLFTPNKRISRLKNHTRFSACSSGDCDKEATCATNHEQRVKPSERLVCTNLKELEIWKNDCDWLLFDADFTVVCQWTKLRKLTISGVKLMGKMDFVLSVAKNCPMLELLNFDLIDVSFSPGGFACQLMNALLFFRNLKVLRLNQPYFNITRPFISSIYECKRLHSLCIITHGGQITEGVSFLELFNMCQDLSVMLISCESPAAQLKRIQKDLVHRFRPYRPSLFVAMLPSVDKFTKVPFCIKNDLIHIKSRVACAVTG